MPEVNCLTVQWIDGDGGHKIEEHGVLHYQDALQVMSTYMQQYNDVQFTWSEAVDDPFAEED